MKKIILSLFLIPLLTHAQVSISPSTSADQTFGPAAPSTGTTVTLGAPIGHRSHYWTDGTQRAEAAIDWDVKRVYWDRFGTTGTFQPQGVSLGQTSFFEPDILVGDGGAVILIVFRGNGQIYWESWFWDGISQYNHVFGPTQISQSPAGQNYTYGQPRLAMNKSGNVVCAWSSRPGTPTREVFATVGNIAGFTKTYPNGFNAAQVFNATTVGTNNALRGHDVAIGDAPGNNPWVYFTFGYTAPNGMDDGLNVIGIQWKELNNNQTNGSFDRQLGLLPSQGARLLKPAITAISADITASTFMADEDRWAVAANLRETATSHSVICYDRWNGSSIHSSILNVSPKLDPATAITYPDIAAGIEGIGVAWHQDHTPFTPTFPQHTATVDVLYRHCTYSSSGHVPVNTIYEVNDAQFPGSTALLGPQGYPCLTSSPVVVGYESMITYKDYRIGQLFKTYENIQAYKTSEAFTEVESDATDLLVYPNPSNGIMHVNPEWNNKTFAVYNLQGQVVSQGTLQSNTLDVSSLPKGVYQLTMDSSVSTRIVLH